MNNQTTIQEKSFYFLTFFAIVIYCQHAWLTGMFPDGHLYMAFSKNAVEKGYWLVPHLSNSIYAAFADHIPFIFILQGFFFKIFGPSYTTARIFSSLFSLGTFILIYRTLNKENKLWAILGSFLFIIIPPLMKKTRFPGLDTPMMFFSFASLILFYQYYKSRKIIYSLSSGVLWGFALLSKGPIALFVPLSAIIFILIKREWTILRNINLYLIAVIGLLVFSIWPITLFLTGNEETFYTYIHATFIHTAQNSRGVVENDYFSYFIFLVKQVSILVILSFFSIKYFLKSKNDLVLISIIAITAIIFPLSLIKHKYSHYLLSLYPWLAILSSYIVVKVKENKRLISRVDLSLAVLSCLTATILLIFPLTIKSSRDTTLRKIHRVSKALSISPKQWGVVDNSYSFFNVVSLISYRDGGEVFNLSKSQFSSALLRKEIIPKPEMQWNVDINNNGWAFIVKNKLWNSIENKGEYIVVGKFKDDILLVSHKSSIPDGILDFSKAKGI